MSACVDEWLWLLRSGCCCCWVYGFIFVIFIVFWAAAFNVRAKVCAWLYTWNGLRSYTQPTICESTWYSRNKNGGIYRIMVYKFINNIEYNISICCCYCQTNGIGINVLSYEIISITSLIMREYSYVCCAKVNIGRNHANSLNLKYAFCQKNSTKSYLFANSFIHLYNIYFTLSYCVYFYAVNWYVCVYSSTIILSRLKCQGSN